MYLNYGSNFLKQNEVLKIVALGEGFEDPDTGEIIGAEEELRAVIRVTQLRPKYSIAEIMLQSGELSVGDVANRMSKKSQQSASKIVKSCKSADKSMKRSCKKAGSKCDKATQKKITACTLN